MASPFFNLIVPTKSRVNTLYWTLRTLLLQDYPHYQIIVSDNCSEDNTEEVVKAFNNDKIKYYRTPQRLSMASNYEFALSKVEKGYVMVIGDDDGLTNNALSLLAPIIEKHKPAAFIGKKFVYNWDNYPSPNWANLLAKPSGGNACFWVNSQEALSVVANQMYIFNFFNYGGISMASIYHGGCASVELIQQIIKKDGRFFNCQFPDYYSAIRLTVEVEQFLFIETPYFISGASGNSTGASAFLNEKDKKSEFQQFQKDNDIALEAPLVFCHSFALFTAEAILKAHQFSSKVKMFDWQNLFDKMLGDASVKPSKGQYDDVVEKMLQIAEKKGIKDVVEKLVQETPYVEKQQVRIAEGETTYGAYYYYHTEKHNIKNIEDASKFATALIKGQTPKLTNTQLHFAKVKLNHLIKRVLVKAKSTFKRS